MSSSQSQNDYSAYSFVIVRIGKSRFVSFIILFFTLTTIVLYLTSRATLYLWSSESSTRLPTTTFYFFLFVKYRTSFESLISGANSLKRQEIVLSSLISFLYFLRALSLYQINSCAGWFECYSRNQVCVAFFEHLQFVIWYPQLECLIVPKKFLYSYVMPNQSNNLSIPYRAKATITTKCWATI